MTSPGGVPPGSRSGSTSSPASVRCRGEPRPLRGLAHPFPALEDDEQPGLRHAGQPSVMIGEAAPALMPSAIHWFTRSICLSKLSCATTARW